MKTRGQSVNIYRDDSVGSLHAKRTMVQWTLIFHTGHGGFELPLIYSCGVLCVHWPRIRNRFDFPSPVRIAISFKSNKLGWSSNDKTTILLADLLRSRDGAFLYLPLQDQWYLNRHSFKYYTNWSSSINKYETPRSIASSANLLRSNRYFEWSSTYPCK